VTTLTCPPNSHQRKFINLRKKKKPGFLLSNDFNQVFVGSDNESKEKGKGENGPQKEKKNHSGEKNKKEYKAALKLLLQPYEVSEQSDKAECGTSGSGNGKEGKRKTSDVHRMSQGTAANRRDNDGKEKRRKERSDHLGNRAIHDSGEQQKRSVWSNPGEDVSVGAPRRKPDIRKKSRTGPAKERRTEEGRADWTGTEAVRIKDIRKLLRKRKVLHKHEADQKKLKEKPLRAADLEKIHAPKTA